MTEALADPMAARDHARAMAGTVVEAMPVVPPVAGDLPANVPAEDLLWEETIAAGGYATRRIARGSRLRLIDLAGDACASLLIFNAEMPSERLNVADTVKVQWNAYLGAGKLLLSDMGRVLMSILVDEAGTHDAFCGVRTRRPTRRSMARAATAALFPMAATACCWARRNTACSAVTFIPA